MKFDTSNLRRAVRRLAYETHRGKDKIMRSSAKGFIREVIKITPPASQGITGQAAKKAGEEAIVNDILKLAVAVTVVGGGKNKNKVLATPAQLLAAHEAARHGTKGGRVNPRNRKEKLPMKISDITRVIRQLQTHVGFLAAGWNKAATSLGVSVPAWIKRHGDSAGISKLTVTKTSFRLEVGNTVKFVGDVDGYYARIGKALSYQTAAIQRQLAYLISEAKRKAGFK